MKDVNDLMQAILEMDAAQRRESEKARLERSARLAALDEQKQKILTVGYSTASCEIKACRFIPFMQKLKAALISIILWIS